MQEPQGEDDLWGWLLIGLIIAVVTVALYAPLVWQLTHRA
jgi:hypothetical protein